MYVIKTKNGLLDGIYFGEYPTTRKLYFNEDTDKLEPKFAMGKMVKTSNNCNSYLTFNTHDEAVEYIQYMKRDCEDNRSRWEQSLSGSTNKVIAFINDFTIVNQLQ